MCAAPVLANRSVAFVGKWGTNDAGYNAVGAPMAFLTIAAALADLAANYPAATATAPHIVSIEAGTYTTPAFALPPFTFIVGDPDGPTDPTSAVIISLTGNVTLSAGWSVNQTAFGGIRNLTLRQTTAQNIDFTMPTPAAGNPARTVRLEGVITDVDNVVFQATSTADVLQMRDLTHDGNTADAITLEGGSIQLRNVDSIAPVTINAAAIATNSQVYNLFITATGAKLTCNANGAAACTVRLGACDLRALTLGEAAAGVITVSADAVSIPLTASVTYTGTATTADLVRTTDSGGIGPISGTFYGLNGQTITGDINGAWAILANGTNQNITATPSGTGLFITPASLRVGTTANGVGAPTLNRFVSVGTATLAENVGFLLSNGDGVVNLRTQFFLDATNERFGLGLSYSSAADPRYCLRFGGVDMLQMTQGGISLFGTTTNSGNGRIQIVTHTTFAGGLALGPDLSFWRNATGVAIFGSSAGSGSSSFRVQRNQADDTYAEILADGTAITFAAAFGGTGSYKPIVFKTANTNALTLSTGQLVIKNADNFLNRSLVSMADGSAAQVGTLTNAPIAGNPTKWVGIDDNGTTRYVPAW